MANFKTHLQYATLGSGLAATLLLNADLVSPEQAFLCWIAGTVGGILPDVDSDNSQSLGIIFGLFSVVACAITAITTISMWPLIWVWLACAVVFVVIQYGVRYVFESFTKHRGGFHSVLAGLFFGLIITSLSNVVGASSTASWFYGLFIFFGYVIHLVLDEAYAVDFSNASIKRSFGSALKFFDYKNFKVSAVLMVCVIGLFFLTPSYSEFLDIISDKDTYAGIMASIAPLQK